MYVYVCTFTTWYNQIQSGYFMRAITNIFRGIWYNLRYTNKCVSVMEIDWEIVSDKPCNGLGAEGIAFSDPRKMTELHG